MISRRPLFAVLFFTASISGCGRAKNPVSGTVTYRNQPLAAGYITFFPTNGTGTSLGANVDDGRYQIADVPPGPYRILVTVRPKVDVSAKVKLMPTGEIPPNAGNNSTHEIRPQQRNLDLALSAKEPNGAFK